MDKIKKNLINNLFFYTRNVLIETTNRCNYSNIHLKCPLSLIKEKKILSFDYICKVLDELGKYDFSGIIYPFNYSEPLIDPRFFLIIREIKKRVPKARVWIYTNGFMVDDNMLKELDDLGIERINFSVYSESEGIYIHKMILRNRDSMNVTLRAYQRYPFCQKMNDKISWYESNPININRGCPSPYKFLTINSFGEVIICCHDWKRKHVLGNIKEESIKDIFLKDEVIEMYYNLIKGDRNKYYLCSRCNKHR